MAKHHQYNVKGHSAPTSRRIALELEVLRRREHGRLTPHTVVAAAQAKNSPLHKFFDWDDSSAGYKHRLWQARQLIQNVVVKLSDVDAPPTRAFVSVNMTPREPRSYTRVDVAMRHTDMREQLLREAWQTLTRWRRQYKQLSELAEIFAAIDARAQRQRRRTA